MYSPSIYNNSVRLNKYVFHVQGPLNQSVRMHVQLTCTVHTLCKMLFFFSCISFQSPTQISHGQALSHFQTCNEIWVQD